METRRTRRQTRLIDLHVSGKDHGDPPGHGLRQGGRCRGHQGPSGYCCLEAWRGWWHRDKGDQKGWDSEALRRRLTEKKKRKRGGREGWRKKRKEGEERRGEC